MKILNKFKVLFFLLAMLNYSCHSQNKNDNDIRLLLTKCKSKPTKKNLKLFFDVFPITYNELQNTFGYSDEKGEAPYYKDGEEYLLMFFKSSQGVDKKLFIDKLITISSTGKWDADNINSFQEKLRGYFFLNDETFLSILNKKNKNVVKGFWYFFSDEPVFNNKNHSKILSLLKTNKKMKQIYVEIVQKVKEDNIH
jgi:hypothetical protein